MAKRFKRTGKLIREEMENIGLTVVQFAVVSGISLMDMNDILEKDIPITEENAKKIGKALNIKWETIYQYDKYYRIQCEQDSKSKAEESKDGNCNNTI